MAEGVAEPSGLSELTARAALVDPRFAEGIRDLDVVTRADGALTTAEKSVLLTAGAAVRDPVGLPSEVERAIGLGVSKADLAALALTLYLSRGAGPSRAVLDAIGADGDTPPPTPRSVPSPSVDEMVADFRWIFGVVPDRVALLAEHSVSGLAAYHTMRRASLEGDGLAPMLAELALVTVNACEHRADFATVHAIGARRAGATETQLVEAGLCAVPGGGVAAWLAATDAIVAARDVRADPNPTSADITSTDR